MKLQTNETGGSLVQRTWLGYQRRNGPPGIRNLVLVIYTVECSKHVAQKIAQGYDDVHVIGFPGCQGSDYATRMLIAAASNPNVGAVLIVGLGCEYTRSDFLEDEIRRKGKPAESFLIQECGGTSKSINFGRTVIDRFRAELKNTKRTEMGIKDLLIGAECGASDATSGIVGNPVVGNIADMVVDNGGTVFVEEIVELIGLLPYLQKRASNSGVKQDITSAYDKMEEYCKRVQHYSLSPGNRDGGLTTIEEKSLGAFAKSGSRPIQGVLKVSETAPAPGLWLIDSVPDEYFMDFGYADPNDSESIMNLIAAGAHIVLFITGRGSVVGSPISPTLKVTGNPTTYEHLSDDMDFNAGVFFSSDLTMGNIANKLLEKVLEICSGESATKSEELGHLEYHIDYKYQDVGCLPRHSR